MLGCAHWYLGDVVENVFLHINGEGWIVYLSTWCHTYQYLYLLQIELLDVWWVIHGAKGMWQQLTKQAHPLASCAPCPTCWCLSVAVSPLVVLCSLFVFKVWGVWQNLIPYLEQLILPNVSFEWWIIDPYLHDLLDHPSKAVWLPTHNGKTAHTGMVTCGFGMVIEGGSCPEMFLQSSTKCPCRLPYTHLITFQSVTHVPVCYSPVLYYPYPKGLLGDFCWWCLL